MAPRATTNSPPTNASVHPDIPVRPCDFWRSSIWLIMHISYSFFRENDWLFSWFLWSLWLCAENNFIISTTYGRLWKNIYGLICQSDSLSVYLSICSRNWTKFGKRAFLVAPAIWDQLLDSVRSVASFSICYWTSDESGVAVFKIRTALRRHYPTNWLTYVCRCMQMYVSLLNAVRCPYVMYVRS